MSVKTAEQKSKPRVRGRARELDACAVSHSPTGGAILARAMTTKKVEMRNEMARLKELFERPANQD